MGGDSVINGHIIETQNLPLPVSSKGVFFFFHFSPFLLSFLFFSFIIIILLF